MKQTPRTLFLFVLIGLATLSRLLPHPVNFTPLLAIALLAGRQLPRGFAAPAIVVTSMLAIDLPYLVSQVLPQSTADLVPKILLVNGFVYGTILSLTYFAQHIRGLKDWQFTLVGSFASSLAFFLTTNFASWLAFYPLSITSFAQCYSSAIPFFKNTWISTLLYGGTFHICLSLFDRYTALRSHRAISPQN